MINIKFTSLITVLKNTKKKNRENNNIQDQIAWEIQVATL